MKHQPQILHLSNPKHAAKAATHMAKGKPIVTDYGSTFGTAFIGSVRDQVAILRRETPPLAVVSLVTTYSQTSAWLNYDKLHPLLHTPLKNHALRFLEFIAFLRLPANSLAQDQLGENYISSTQEFQSFIVPDSDPLLKALIGLGHPYYAVRSSNISGRPEEFTVEGALTYATEISSPVLAVTHPQKITDQNLRKRLGSQPILRFPRADEPPVVILTRAGSTHPEAIEILIRHLFPQVGFAHREEKSGPPRTQYHPKDDAIPLDANSVRLALLKAAGLVQ